MEEQEPDELTTSLKEAVDKWDLLGWPRPKVAVPARLTENEYDDEAPLRSRRFVPERY